jgi:cysteine desulfuration protein SufE
MSEYNLPPILEKRFNQFKKIDNKTKMFERIISLGKKLPAYPAEAQTEENLVKGCASVTYVKGTLAGEVMNYQGDSNSHLVKGLLALLIEGFNDVAPADILKADPKFIQDMGLSSALTASRANGFMNTYAMMMESAKKALNLQNG